MSKGAWTDGILVWKSEKQDAAKLRKGYLNSEWRDGYVAFSTVEKRLAEFGLDKIKMLLAGRADTQGGPEGFLMEAGLWRFSANGIYEELSLEREGDQFVVRYWKVRQKKEGEKANCFFRPANTFVRGNLTNLFKDKIPSLEVIAHEHRLRVYLTIGGK